jgi:hypothetical protein
MELLRKVPSLGGDLGVGQIRATNHASYYFPFIQCSALDDERRSRIP